MDTHVWLDAASNLDNFRLRGNCSAANPGVRSWLMARRVSMTYQEFLNHILGIVVVSAKCWYNFWCGWSGAEPTESVTLSIDRHFECRQIFVWVSLYLFVTPARLHLEHFESFVRCGARICYAFACSRYLIYFSLTIGTPIHPSAHHRTNIGGSWSPSPHPTPHPHVFFLLRGAAGAPSHYTPTPSPTLFSWERRRVPPTYYLLPIACYTLPTPYYLLFISYYQLLIITSIIIP